MAGPIAQAMRAKLEGAFLPERLEIVDDSARHAGHAGAGLGEGETHFNVLIEASTFNGMGRVARQRAVYAVLAEELAGPVHALSVRVLGLGEVA
jgi:BolA protein